MDLWRFVALDFKPLTVINNLNLLCTGGFDIGDTSQNPGDTVVARSIALGEPVIYVSTNYRLQGAISSCNMKIRIFIGNYLALGFLGGKEAQAAKIGNLGIGDRRHLIQLHMIPKILNRRRALCIEMGPGTHFCLRW